MRRTLAVVVVASLLIGLLGCALALAQDQEYALKDYMPQTVGSKWTMKTMGRQGETTITYEIDKARDVAGQPVTPLLTKDAQGNLTRGSLETVSDSAYTILGQIFVPRGQPGQPAGAPTDRLYNPALVFPAKLKAGQSVEVTTKVNFQGQDTEVKAKLELAAVESVTVPKGTFADCLKLVVTTSFGDRVMKRTSWYAKGVGLVKTESPGFGQNSTPRVAELTDYALAQ